MNILGKIKRLFNKKVSGYTVSQETDAKKRVQSEIILTEKESLELDREKRRERFTKWLNEHNRTL